MRLTGVVLLSCFIGLPAVADVCSVTHQIYFDKAVNTTSDADVAIVALSKADGEADVRVSADKQVKVFFETGDSVVQLSALDESFSTTKNRRLLDEQLRQLAFAFNDIRIGMLYDPESRRPEVAATKFSAVFANKAYSLPNAPENFTCLKGVYTDEHSKRPIFYLPPRHSYVLPQALMVQLFEGSARLNIL